MTAAKQMCIAGPFWPVGDFSFASGVQLLFETEGGGISFLLPVSE